MTEFSAAPSQRVTIDNTLGSACLLVDGLVPDEAAVERVALPTRAALELPLPRVDTLVDLQVVGGGEAFAAHGAHVRPLPRVHLLVPL